MQANQKKKQTNKTKQNKKHTEKEGTPIPSLSYVRNYHKPCKQKKKKIK